MKRIAALAVALAAALALPAPAVAVGDPNPPPPISWIWCQPGEVTQITVTGYMIFEGSNGWAFNVGGTVQPCTQPSTTDVFAIAGYHADGRVDGLAREYWKHRWGTYAGPQIRLTADTVAVCVISDSTIRHACYGIAWSGSTPSSTGPIPLDAPEVSHPASLGNFHTWDDDDPECIHCP